MGLEFRNVLPDWKHPIDDQGQYGYFSFDYYGDVLKEWLKNNAMWENGTHPDLVENPNLKNVYPFWAMYGRECPLTLECYTEKVLGEQLTHIQLYSNVSDTPKSPVYPASEYELLILFMEQADNDSADFYDVHNFRVRYDVWKSQQQG